MRLGLVAATVAALLIPATEAVAGDPVMPLGEVRAGMQCTGYSVVRGTDDRRVRRRGDRRRRRPARRAAAARILIRASGPAVDETGLGPGFSGSPIYCPDAQGTARNIGAISESVGEYGGKVALATPIEAILGNPVDAPHATRGARDARAGQAAHRAADDHRADAEARQRAAGRGGQARAGRARRAGRAARLVPGAALRPGSAFGVGYASGDLAASAIGTVAYTDGDRVWGFGHPLDGVGAPRAAAPGRLRVPRSSTTRS